MVTPPGPAPARGTTTERPPTILGSAAAAFGASLSRCNLSSPESLLLSRTVSIVLASDRNFLEREREGRSDGERAREGGGRERERGKRERERD